MSKIYRLIIISIMALIFAIGCSDTSSQSSGGGNITDNGSSGGNGGDGSGSSSEIINSTMRASASQDNALLYTFFTPASATNGASLKYSWDFDDNAVETTDNNIINHEFSKYGKSYNVTLEVSNMQTNDKENVSMIIPLPKPTIYFACSSAGLDIYCLPNISQQGIMDVEYTWNIYNSSNQQIASLNTTGSHELATYTLPLSGTYQVELIGRSEKVDGDLIYTENVEVSQSFNKGSISYSILSSDKLQYRLRYSAGSTNGDILNYCWEIDEEINSGKCESDANYHQGTSSTYDEIMHTFPKYKKAYNIKGYVKDASGENPAVSSAIIYQDLPVVAVTVTGTGLSKKFSPVFTYKPAGSLQYIWSFGDGAQSSAESPEHTYQKSGYYTVSLEIISDKFDTSIGSIKSEDLNININEHINNVVIETSLKARDKSGEKYVITSPAESTNGALYYIWKVDGAVVSEGENIHTLEYSFPVFGKSYSVSLEVEDKTTGTKVIAEPKVITTKKPIAKIVLPPYSTPNTQVQIQAKLYFEDTGEDFVLIADNPQYEWYINGQNENQNKPSIDKVFTKTQQVPVKLNISAENIEGRELSAESTIYINELNLECSIADDAEDMYGAIVSCQIPTDIEGSTSYYYKYTYTEYMNGVPTLVEVPATEKTQFKIKLYEEDSLIRTPSREFTIHWNAGQKDSYQYSGSIPFTYTAKTPKMDKVIDFIEYGGSVYSGIVLTEKKHVFYTDYLTYSYMYPFYYLNEKVNKFMKSIPESNESKIYYQCESGNIYVSIYQYKLENLQKINNIEGILENVFVAGNVNYVVTDTGVYMLDFYLENATKVLDKKIKKIVLTKGTGYQQVSALLLADDNSLYLANHYNNGMIEPLMPELKFKDIIGEIHIFDKYTTSSTELDSLLHAENGDIYGFGFNNDLKQMKIKKASKQNIGTVTENLNLFAYNIHNNGIDFYLINGKLYDIYETENEVEFRYHNELFNSLSIDKVIYFGYGGTGGNGSYYDGYFIITTNGDVYGYSDNAGYMLGIVGYNTGELKKIEQLKGVTNINVISESNYVNVSNNHDISADRYDHSYYGYGSSDYDIVIAYTEDGGIYEWGGNNGNIPLKVNRNYKIIDDKIRNEYVLTTAGLYYIYDNHKDKVIDGSDNVIKSQSYMCLTENGRFYVVESKQAILVNKEYFDSIGQ